MWTGRSRPCDGNVNMSALERFGRAGVRRACNLLYVSANDVAATLEDVRDGRIDEKR